MAGITHSDLLIVSELGKQNFMRCATAAKNATAKPECRAKAARTTEREAEDEEGRVRGVFEEGIESIRTGNGGAIQ